MSDREPPGGHAFCACLPCVYLQKLSCLAIVDSGGSEQVACYDLCQFPEPLAAADGLAVSDTDDQEPGRDLVG